MKWSTATLIFLYLVGIFSTSTSARHRRRRTHTLPSVEGECYLSATSSGHLERFAKWWNFKNATHYSPILPNEALKELQNVDMNGNRTVSSCDSCNASRTCTTQSMAVVSAETPLRDRAVCKYEYVVNYNARRLPSTIVEAKCTCPSPPETSTDQLTFECKPLRYDVRVLLFDDECASFKPSTETISLACIPVVEGGHAQTEMDFIVPVPAEVPG